MDDYEEEYHTNFEDVSFFRNPVTDKITPNGLQFDWQMVGEEHKKGIPAEATRLVLHIEEDEHLESLLLKSDSATLHIRELDFTCEASSAKFGSIRSQIEYLLHSLESAPFSHPKMEEVLDRLREGAEGKHKFTFVVEDILCRSEKQEDSLFFSSFTFFFPPRSQIQPVKGMKVEVEHFQRNWEQLREYDLAEKPKVRYLGEHGVDKLVELVSKAKKVVCLSGAGCSVESGIPAWRNTNKGDIWKNYSENAINYNSFMEDLEVRKAYWNKSLYFWAKRKEALPNPAHFFFAKLKKQGKLLKVVTQNIGLSFSFYTFFFGCLYSKRQPFPGGRTPRRGCCDHSWHFRRHSLPGLQKRVSLLGNL